jgi:type II secretory pathway pseudopilin PulG
MNQKINTWLALAIVAALAGAVALLALKGSVRLAKWQDLQNAGESQNMAQKESQIQAKNNSSSNAAETLSFCGRKFIAEKLEVNGVDIVKRCLELYLAQDKESCVNFDQIKNVAVLKTTGDIPATRFIFYEKNALSDADRKLPVRKQLEKIFNNPNYPQVNEFDLEGNSIFTVSEFDGSSQFLGKLK